jgi:hypothetical protein
MYPPMHAADDQRYGTSLSMETTHKIEELKRLMNRYPQYHPNPDAIIRWAVFFNGDNKFLDEKLEQLRRLDSYNTLQQRHGIQNGIYNIGY